MARRSRENLLRFLFATVRIWALPETVWVRSSPSGRGIPLRACSPRCCNERPPRCGSPHPPRRGGSPIRPCLMRQARTVGPRWGGRCAHQRGSPARSRHPRPDGLVRVSRPSRGSKDLARGTVAMAGLMTGVAWLIPYCARHHPLHLEEQRVPGTFLSARCASTGDQPGRPASPPFVSRSSFSLKSPSTRKPEDPRFGTLLASLPAFRTPNSWSGIDRRRAMRHIIRRQASILLQRIHKTLCAWPLLCYDSGQRLRTATQPGRP